MTKQKHTKSDPKKDKVLQLSVSSVEMFNSCKAKWYYNYVERLPSPKNYYNTAGSFIHKILEILLRRYKKSNDMRDAARVAYCLAQRDEGIQPDLTEEIRSEGKDWLKQLVKQYEKQPSRSELNLDKNKKRLEKLTKAYEDLKKEEKSSECYTCAYYNGRLSTCKKFGSCLSNCKFFSD